MARQYCQHGAESSHGKMRSMQYFEGNPKTIFKTYSMLQTAQSNAMGPAAYVLRISCSKCQGWWDFARCRRGYGTRFLYCSRLVAAEALQNPEGPGTQYFRTLVLKTIPLMVFGIRVLKYWLLGSSRLAWRLHHRLSFVKPDLLQWSPSEAKVNRELLAKPCLDPKSMENHGPRHLHTQRLTSSSFWAVCSNT